MSPATGTPCLAAMLLVGLIGASVGVGCGGDPPQPATGPETVTLRFRPRAADGAMEAHHVYLARLSGGSGEGAAPAAGARAHRVELALARQPLPDAETRRAGAGQLAEDREAVGVKNSVRWARLDGKTLDALTGVELIDVWSPAHRQHGVSSVVPAAADAGGGALAQPVLAHRVAALLSLSQQVAFPDGPVSVARTWTAAGRGLVVPNLGAVRVDGAYTLRQLSTDGSATVARIEAELRVSQASRSTYRTLQVSAEGSGTATFEVLVADGTVRRGTIGLALVQTLKSTRGTIVARRELDLSGAWRSDALTTPLRVPRMPPVAPTDGQACRARIDDLERRLEALPRMAAPVATGAIASGLRGVRVPTHPGLPIDTPGSIVLLQEHDPDRARLGDALWRKGTPPPVPIQAPVYVIAHANTKTAQLNAWLSVLPRGQARIITRDPRAPEAGPPAPRWQREAVATALQSRSLTARQHQLVRLLRGQLELCPGAREAVESQRRQGRALPSAALFGELSACGCRAVDMDGLEATLREIGGGQDLRYVPLSRPLPPGTTLARALGEAR